MTSPKDRRVVSQKSLERQNSKGDDPWCLTCGVNLALEGRTFTVVSRHTNSELCDIFSRVLGAEFSQEYASVNVCNRCERQLRRLGRYNSIILARHEAEKLREQLENNLAKHGQKVVEAGRVEDIPSSAIEDTSSKSETSFSVNVSGKGQGYDGYSSIRREGKQTSRSVGSVHFGDQPNPVKKKIAVRKYSAPDGNRNRDLRSPFSEIEKRREARHRKWSSASSTSEEFTPASPTSSADRRLLFGGRSIALTSHLYRDEQISNQKSQSTDPEMNSDEAIIEDPSAASQELEEQPKEPSLSELETAEQEMASDKEKDAPLEKSGDMEEPLQRMDTLQADDELFTKLETETFKEPAPDSESPNEAEEEDPNDYNADTRSLSDVEERITNKAKFKGQYYNIGSTEDLLQEFANEQDREKARWSKLTYTESVDVGDGSDFGSNPMRPPRRKSGRSSHKKKGNQIQTHNLEIKENSIYLDDITSENISTTNVKSRLRVVDDSRSFRRVSQTLDSIPETETCDYNRKTEKIKMDSYCPIKSDGSSSSCFNEPIEILLSYMGGSIEGMQNVPTQQESRARQQYAGTACGDIRAGGRTQDGSQVGGNDNESCTAGHDSDVIGNGQTVLEEQDESAVSLEATDTGDKSSVKFTKDSPEGEELKVAPEGGITTKKSEKSPLIGKDGGKSSLRMSNGNESRVKDQLPGFLCCTVL